MKPIEILIFAVLHWLTKGYHSKSYFRKYEDFYDIHGHPEYGTVIEWLDP